MSDSQAASDRVGGLLADILNITTIHSQASYNPPLNDRHKTRGDINPFIQDNGESLPNQ
ncbi:hypothetical protein [Endozoicomonas sp. ISHI1]|uniref:hypothetical protein n=1 Tax=Endozoicomonas sp. ISHI1 TaxID=2825882 RepID=UPI002149625C|nr:hypothetical protein [Endozoicomonas sp. ISHI1]